MYIYWVPYNSLSVSCTMVFVRFDSVISTSVIVVVQSITIADPADLQHADPVTLKAAMRNLDEMKARLTAAMKCNAAAAK